MFVVIYEETLVLGDDKTLQHVYDVMFVIMCEQSASFGYANTCSYVCHLMFVISYENNLPFENNSWFNLYDILLVIMCKNDASIRDDTKWLKKSLTSDGHDEINLIKINYSKMNYFCVYIRNDSSHII